MTFQVKDRFSSRSDLSLRFLQICTIIGFIAPWTTLANSTIPKFSQPNQSIKQFQNENSTNFKNLIAFNAVLNNLTNKNNTMKENTEDEETTFSPETVLFHLSDRKQFNYFDKKKNNNTKFMVKKKKLNATNYNQEPVKALEINSNELPVERNPQKHPEHKLSKHPASINLESRMLFDRDKE